MQRQHQQEIADAAIASAKAASEAAEAQRQLQLEASTAASAAEIRQQQEAAVMLAHHAVAAERAAGERTVAQVQRSSDKLHTQFPASCLRDPSNCRLHVANSLTAAAAGDGPTA